MLPQKAVDADARVKYDSRSVFNNTWGDYEVGTNSLTINWVYVDVETLTVSDPQIAILRLMSPYFPAYYPTPLKMKSFDHPVDLTIWRRAFVKSLLLWMET